MTDSRSPAEATAKRSFNSVRWPNAVEKRCAQAVWSKIARRDVYGVRCAFPGCPVAGDRVGWQR